jgi:histidine ammonia-lyase
MRAFARISPSLALVGSLLMGGGAAIAQSPSSGYAPGPVAYNAITPTMADQTITLTGHDLTIEQVIAVARYGAKVRFAPGAMQRAQQASDLRAEAVAENIPVYGQNRGAGDMREIKKTPQQADTASGFPVLPMLGAGALPEISHEDLVRADLLIGANTSILGASDPKAMQMTIDLLNNRITPVAYSIGTLGEADFPAVSNNIQATMSGQGEAYYRGERMPAARALSMAGLKPLAGSEFFNGAENAYGDARAALLVADGRRALEWADVLYALDKLGMDSSISPMLAAVQAQRPFPWVNWDAARIMDMLNGSYLYQAQATRILQDAESMRARYIRNGSAWKAWATLRDDVQRQINSADLNPLVLLGASPSDSPQLASPFMMQFYVKGGPLSHGQHGYVFSTANWDPYPMANEEEAFTNALANMDVAVAQTIERFTDRTPIAFFTGVLPKDVLTPEQIRKSPFLSEPFWVVMDLWQQIQSLAQSIVPEGNATDLGVADIEGQTRLKTTRGQEVVDLTMKLLGYDLWNATYWLDVRHAQNASWNFGPVATGVWNAFRQVVPWQQEPSERAPVPYGIAAYQFLESTPATRFYPGGPPMPSPSSN